MPAEALATALAALLLGLAVAGLVAARRLAGKLEEIDDALALALARGLERSAQLELLEKLRDRQQLAEHAVDAGASIVREVHRGIARIPFSILENIPATAPGARAARQMHDAISEGIYGALSGLNKAVGRELRKGIGETGPDTASPPGPESPAVDEKQVKRT